jgi:hypothetical protein
MAKHKSADQIQEAPNEPATNPPSEQQQAGEEQPKKTKRPFKVVQGWHSHFTGPLKYQKFTDADLNIIAFKRLP